MKPDNRRLDYKIVVELFAQLLTKKIAAILVAAIFKININ